MPEMPKTAPSPPPPTPPAPQAPSWVDVFTKPAAYKNINAHTVQPISVIPRITTENGAFKCVIL